MFSFLSMIIKTISNALVYALKAFFSLISWFLKSFIKLVKLFYVALPVTCFVFFLLFFLNIFLLLGGFNTIISTIPEDTQVMQVADPMLHNGRHVVISVFSELYRWWMFNVYSYHGKAAYIPLFILTILMFIPVVCVFLCISVFLSFGNVLFIAVVVDAILYLLRALMGKSFLSQAMGRYYRLFPEAGRKHEEKQYDKLMKKRNREMEAEDRQRKRDKRAEFYDEDDYSENYEDEEDYPEDYEDDYYESDEDYEDEEFEDSDDYYEDEEDDEDYDEDDEYYEEDFEDDYDEPRSRREPAPSSFDFFAGCNSLESVNRKYKSLVKLYHPDNMDGDTAALQQINAQYAEAKKRFK